MKNKLLILLGVSLLVLAGCNKSNSSSDTDTNETESVETESFDIVERQYTYTNKITEPSSTIHNMEDFKLITDYHAFYKDVKRFDLTIASDYVYETTQKTVDSEINYLYWYGELINGVMGISGKEKDKNTWTIEYQYYENAVEDGRETAVRLDDLFYVEPTSDRSSDYDGFATEDKTKPVADVATTQQLWYAAEHGYSINTLPNSSAEKYYNKAKELLRNIIKNDMTDYEKTATIYDYIEHHASYCYEALDLPDSDDPANFPDVNCARHKAFFIEGFFDNNTVVCDGFSKVYTLLGRMEGLEIVRGSGTSDDRWITKEVAGHAYCFVNIDGQYYLSCPTWGQVRITQKKFVLHKTYFLAPKSYMSNYPCLDWQDLNYAYGSNISKYFKNIKVEMDGEELTPYITNQSYSSYLTQLQKSRGTFMDLYFSDSSVKSSFINGMRGKMDIYEISQSEVVFYYN